MCTWFPAFRNYDVRMLYFVTSGLQCIYIDGDRLRYGLKILIQNPMVTLSYAEIFTLHRVGFRFQF